VSELEGGDVFVPDALAFPFLRGFGVLVTTLSVGKGLPWMSWPGLEMNGRSAQYSLEGSGRG